MCPCLYRVYIDSAGYTRPDFSNIDNRLYNLQLSVWAGDVQFQLPLGIPLNRVNIKHGG